MDASDAARTKRLHENGADLVVAAGVFLVIAIAITADTGGTRHLDGYAYLFAAALGALMLARHRYPVGTLLATCVVTCAYYIAHYPPIGLALPLGAALYVAADAGRLRWAVAAPAGLLALSLVFRIRQGEDLRYLFLYDTLLTVAVLAVAIALGDSQRSKRLWRAEVEQRLRQAEHDKEQEAHRRVLDERARIARDLHDSLAHTVSVIALQAEVALESAPDLPPPTSQAMARIRQASREALGELRSTVGVLREREPRQPHASLDSLGALVATMADGGLDVSLRAHGELARVSPLSAAAAYRIVQESLTNTIRHAHCSRAWVDLDVSDGELRVSVTDDGVGDQQRPTTDGHGLRGMTERAVLLGGSLRARPRRQGGFEVQAVLPLGER